MEFTFTQNNREARQRLLRALQAFAREHALPEDVVQAADLALEEHLSNVLTYGYDNAAEVEIRVRFEIDDQGLKVEVCDRGRAFDPTSYPAPDLTLPPEQRPIGGLGIHLMRRFMDCLEHHREEGTNWLVMRKRITPKSKASENSCR